MQSNINDFGSGESDESSENTDGMPARLQAPSNIHTEFADLDEIPDDVPICAEKGQLKLAGRIVRKLHQVPELGHHSTIDHAIREHYRKLAEVGDEPGETYYEAVCGVGPDTWNFGEIDDPTLAKAIEQFAREMYPDAIREATDQYNDQLRDKCKSALKDQREAEADERFAAEPPAELNGWERFESDKPDVKVAYRGENYGTPSVAAVYETGDGLGAHESTLEEWRQAETGAESKVNRHFVSMRDDRDAYGHLRSHLKQFDAEPLDLDESAGAPSFGDYEFSEGDTVAVDWSAGMGPEEQFTGTAEDVSLSGGEVIVSVTDYDSDEFANGKTYDCAPEWIDTDVNEDAERCVDCGRTIPAGMFEKCSDCGDEPEKAEAVTDGGRLDSSEQIPVVDGELPGNERVLIIAGITGVMHTPEVIEGETSGTGKTISVESETIKSARLDAREIFDGESEYRDSRYFELYTPGRLRKNQRSNKAPGPRAGTDSVTDADDLPAPTHWPNHDEPDDAADECPHCGATGATWADKMRAWCEACGELVPEESNEGDERDAESTDDTPDKWDLSRLDRGDVLSLESYGDSYVITKIDTFVGTDTVQRVHVATRDGGEWAEYKLKKVDQLGNTCLNVDRKDETSVMINVDDPDHAQDFEVVDHNQEMLQRYIREEYHSA